MKYFIIIISLLMISGANYPQTPRNYVNINSSINPLYLSIDTYQNDYKTLQEKSLDVNNKVKIILDIIKPH